MTQTTSLPSTIKRITDQATGDLLQHSRNSGHLSSGKRIDALAFLSFMPDLQEATETSEMRQSAGDCLVRLYFRHLAVLDSHPKRAVLLRLGAT